MNVNKQLETAINYRYTTKLMTKQKVKTTGYRNTKTSFT